MSFNNLSVEAKEAVMQALNEAAERSADVLTVSGSVELDITFNVTTSITLDFDDIKLAERGGFEFEVSNLLKEAIPEPHWIRAITFTPGETDFDLSDDGAVEEEILRQLEPTIDNLGMELEDAGSSFDNISAEVTACEVSGLLIDNQVEFDCWREGL